MSKRTLRSATIERENQANRAAKSTTTKSKKPPALTTTTAPASAATGGPIAGLTKHFPDWDGGRIFLLCVSALIILGIFLFNGVTPKAFLYSVGVVFAAKTRI